MQTSLEDNPVVAVIGGGLAGCEVALQLAKHGIKTELFEMRPIMKTGAHKTNYLAELVCSNSLKSVSMDTSSGLLKRELELMGSIIIETAKKHRIPAGSALGVDRNRFSEEVTSIIDNEPNINVIREEVVDLDSFTGKTVIIATGPLTSEKFASNLEALTGSKLYFYDAISPIINADSINYEKCFFKSRYDKGGNDYLNFAMSEEHFELFYKALTEAELVNLHPCENKAYFDACKPIEEIAKSGKRSLTYGPLRPVGLEHPKTGTRYYAVLQLRSENLAGDAYNMVGFQTKMKQKDQKKVFRLIPGLENAEFFRYGSMHRNTYINSPQLLNKSFQLKKNIDIYFAGQITGVEGYVESVASGLMTAYDIIYNLYYKEPFHLPVTTAMGSLAEYVSENKTKRYVPSNFHFGMLPPLDEKVRDKKQKRELLSVRAASHLSKSIKSFV